MLQSLALSIIRRLGTDPPSTKALVGWLWIKHVLNQSKTHFTIKAAHFTRNPVDLLKHSYIPIPTNDNIFKRLPKKSTSEPEDSVYESLRKYREYFTGKTWEKPSSKCKCDSYHSYFNNNIIPFSIYTVIKVAYPFLFKGFISTVGTVRSKL